METCLSFASSSFILWMLSSMGGGKGNFHSPFFYLLIGAIGSLLHWKESFPYALISIREEIVFRAAI